jgi:alkylated DNA repair protein (DNA oxidative demethylase)
MTLPEGLTYVPGFLTETGERDVLAVLATFELHPYVLHDTPSRRLVRSFGLGQVTGAYDAGPAAPIPAELEWLRERCAALMGREPEETAELTLEPCSAYVLSGPARTQWQHHIPPVTQERWSMTFRTLRHAAADTR